MSTMTVRFWGVRGSIACPGAATARYGGNTPCVELRCGERLLIFDGGTGLRALGDALAAVGRTIDADIFLSHCHHDHVAGLPFFSPFHAPENVFRLWAGNLLPTHRLENVMRTLMSPPLFPVTIDTFKANVSYRDFTAGETLAPCTGVMVRTAPLNHPDGATGYRVECGGHVVAYLTDNEMSAGVPDPRLVELARGADLAIYDCTFTDEEIGAKVGWGHSTWRQGLRLADLAGVTTLCLFHHAPEHDDGMMDKIATEAAALRPGTLVAREGAVIEL